jgi:ParB family chromosome partitioning protein
MNKLKTGLGRGLDALIKQQNFTATEDRVADYAEVKKDEGKLTDILAKIPIEAISPNPFQPRIHFDPESFEELKKSILSNGLIQPITVRRIAPFRYQMISGERRLKACHEIGYKEIPAYIIKVDSDEAMLALALIENIQREKLNPIEIGLAYKRLMDECHLTQEQIAEKVGKDRTTVANAIRLLKLPKEVQESLIKEEISAGHARALINLPSQDLQLEALKKILEGNLSVRKVEKLMKKMTAGNAEVINSTINTTQINIKSANLREVEEKLRNVFGTKVSCRQRQDGSGEITIEYYSNDELERLFELFEIINKPYH